MRRCSLLIAMTAFAASTFAEAEENPFVGTWKINPEKSKATGRTITYKKTASGYHVSSSQGQDLDFAVDGKDYVASDGYSESWKKTGERSWDVTEKVSGKAFGTSRHELSADGKTLTEDYVIELPDGKKTTGKVVRSRLTGGQGLEGTWKTSQATIEAEITVITVPSPGHLKMDTPSRNEVIDGPTDGSAFPMVTATTPAGWVATFKLTDPRTLEWSGGLEKKPEIKGIMKISADGRTSTNHYWYVGKESETFTDISEKQ